MIRHSLPTLGVEESEAATRVIQSGMIAQGREVEAFEKETADFVGRKYAVAVNSGTAALHLSLGALGCGTDSIVALPAYACASLVTAVGMNQGVSHLVDIQSQFAMIIKQIPRNADTFIVPHLFGGTSELPESDSVIEDIAQSIGNGTGTATQVAVASFYATKLLTTGEGGMVLTDDIGITDYVRDRRDYDNRDDYVQRFPYKLTDIQAAIGRVQLTKLPGFIQRRRDIAARYTEGLSGLPFELPKDDGNHIFFRYVVMTTHRQALEEHLNKNGIEAKRPVYFPTHRYFDKGATRSVRLESDYPGADRAHEEALSLPIHPQLSDEDIDSVIIHVRNYFEESFKGV